jgi:hypothetical protein
MKPPSLTLSAQGWSLNSLLRFWHREMKTCAFFRAGSSAGRPVSRSASRKKDVFDRSGRFEPP